MRASAFFGLGRPAQPAPNAMASGRRSVTSTLALSPPPLRPAGPMIARVAAARALQAAPSAALPAARGFHASAAQAATLRELEQRIKSVSNIEKITKSMKMIASTQLNKAQRAMDAAKKYGEANQGKFLVVFNPPVRASRAPRSLPGCAVLPRLLRSPPERPATVVPPSCQRPRSSRTR